MNERDMELAKQVYGTAATKQELQFAALIRADEREACAKVCEQFQKDYVYTADLAGAVAAIKRRMADAIRARGNT